MLASAPKARPVGAPPAMMAARALLLAGAGCAAVGCAVIARIRRNQSIERKDRDCEPAGDTAGGWTAKGWLLSLAPEVSDVIATALRVRADGADEFAALRSLSDADIGARLKEGGLSGLIPVVTAGVGQLRQQAAATGAELNSKFSGEQGTFELAFGSTDTFYGGLEVTAPPDPIRAKPCHRPLYPSGRR